MLLSAAIKFVKITTSIEKIVEDFPSSTIDPIFGHPNYDVISTLHQKLNDNATSVHTPLGGIIHRQLTLMVTLAVYNTLPKISYAAPVDR